MHLFNFNPIVSKLIQSYQQKICYYDKQQWEQRSCEDHILARTETFYQTNQGEQHHHNQHNQRSSNNRVNNLNHSKISNNSSNPVNTSNTIPTANINGPSNDLIDLDLISGSAYTMKSKSNQGWISMLFQAILRILFFPLYLRWWSEQTSPKLVGLLLLLYIMQIFAIRLYYQKSFSLSSTSPSNSSTSSSTSSSSSSFNHGKSSDYNNGEITPTEIFMPVAMMIVLGIIHTQIVGTKYIKSSSSNQSSTSSSKSLSPNNSSSNLLYHHHSKNRKNSSHATKDVSQHIDSSSSSGSSTSSSVDSSPVADVRHRVQNRMAKMEKYKQTTNNPNPSPLHIPKIRFDNEFENPKILLIDDNDDDINEELVVDETIKNYNSRNCFRRRSDSMPRLSTTASSSLMTTAPVMCKKLRKPRFKINNSKLTSKLYNNSWNINYDDDNLNSSPISMPSGSIYGSSFESEGTNSPMTPILLRSENEWPRPHSDIGTSDVDDDDHFNKFNKNNDRRTTKPIESNSISMKNNSSNIGKDPKLTSTIDTKNVVEESMDLNSINLPSPPSNELKVSCSLWQYNICQKIDLSVADISSSIIRKVETIEHSTEYIWLGIIFSMIVALIPSLYRIQFSVKEAPSIANILGPHNSSSLPLSPSSSSSSTSMSSSSFSSSQQTSSDIGHLNDLHELFNFFLDEAFFLSNNKNYKFRLMIFIVMFERFCLSLLYFFLLCVTERTFKQRFLYSKYFSHITRRDRAKRSQIPHFRLHKVRNLKVWLSVRSYLRRYGPHRSVDTICSTTFIISICLLTCISLQILRDSNESCLSRLICWEMIFWSLALGIYIMRLMILGSRINQKYRSNLSVLITEQINLYLQLERKPHKKDALMLANQVLKLAVDLLKELESPYKISGFSANPYLYNITKVVVLSAFSAVLTEMLGFKLKLYKIKLIR